MSCQAKCSFQRRQHALIDAQDRLPAAQRSALSDAAGTQSTQLIDTSQTPRQGPASQFSLPCMFYGCSRWELPRSWHAHCMAFRPFNALQASRLPSSRPSSSFAGSCPIPIPRDVASGNPESRAENYQSLSVAV